MSRVEWTRLEGNDVEAVVAMFINREHPFSTRVTPSVGDGGIDILDRNVNGTGLDVVYQVKRHTGPLTSAARAEVEKGLKRLIGPKSPDDEVKRDPRWKDLRVEEWHLVLPWDPSPEAEIWLHGLGDTYGLSRAVWDGLAHVDQLAAKYGDAVDYYLHGGRERITLAYSEFAALFAVGSIDTKAGLDVGSVNERIQTALGSLRHDPLFRYEHRFGEGPIPQLGDRPGLVFSHLTGDTKSGQWTIVDVIARCAASTEIRPITVSGTLHIEPGSDADAEFRDHLAYGTPFSSPPGAYDGLFDAPGGLGGPFEGATIFVGATDDLGGARELHLEVLDPDGIVLAESDINRIERTRGDVGFRVVLEEPNGIFTFEDRYDRADRTGSRTLRFGDVTGKPVSAVADALRFLVCCRPPNTGRLSIRHTPPERGSSDPNIGVMADDDVRSNVEVMLNVMEMLVAIQQHSSALLTVPYMPKYLPEQIHGWRTAAELLSGRQISGSYNEGGALVIELPLGSDLPDGNFVVRVPFHVRVGELLVDLGGVHAIIDNAEMIKTQETESRVFYFIQTADRRVRYSLAPPGTGDDEDNA